MSDTTVSPVAAAVSVGKAPNNIAVSNIWNHMSSTWTAIGLVLAAIAPIVTSSSMPTTGSGWVMEGALFATAIVKALGR